MPMQHIVMVDIDLKVEEAFNLWYNTVHIPRILACPGWLSATRRLSLSGRNHFLFNTDTGFYGALILKRNGCRILQCNPG